MITPRFVLCADGTITRPSLTIILNAETGDVALTESRQKAQALFPAGYTVFTVYRIEDTDARMIEFHLTASEPTLTVKP